MNEKPGRYDILDLDSPPAAFKEALRSHVEGMLIRRLRWWERLLAAMLTVLCIGGGGGCIMLLLTNDVLTPMQRFYLLITVVLAGVGAMWSLSTLKRGVLYTLKDVIRIPAAVWAFLVVILVVEILTNQPDSTIVTTIAAIALIGFPMTWNRITASELRIQEAILHLVISMPDLAAGQPKDADHGAEDEDGRTP